MLQVSNTGRYRLPLLLVVIVFVLCTSGTVQAAHCPFGIFPNPMPLVSYTGTFTYYDSGFQNALVQESFCVFFADFATFQFALSGFPTVGLPTQLDEWFVYDNGTLLPFLPYFEVAFIEYFAIDLTSGEVTADTGITTLTVIPT